ncbi:inovirus Gp2 family protein [Salmonella enterica subsp. enterica serovar Tamberma]|nr:inovirus Gp2 family protein [Salmonella enterica subsp. enterica serovar Tamberma]EBU9957137.1 inovirus Gp2 family protein [Salmonella enterica subsp. enterica serovar Tamberma]EBX4840453.1 inovirus Gp2 family protein [Salmonella enterica subsp. enterica serovar Tamberma]MMG18363.1 inovirus Gp2 family protein [Salmonella enterica subsp. enterica serovar Tamberma]
MRTYETIYGDHVVEYKESIIKTVHKAVLDHPRTLAIRVDLHDPAILDNGDTITCFANTEDAISRFTRSLKAKLSADTQRKQREGKRVYPNTLRYAWVREYSQPGKRHYHAILFLNKDAYYHLGDYSLDHNTLRTMIITAWYSALGLPHEDHSHLVQFPDNRIYFLDREKVMNGRYPGDFIERVDYLTKGKSKSFEDGYRSFGCSNN